MQHIGPKGSLLLSVEELKNTTHREAGLRTGERPAWCMGPQLLGRRRVPPVLLCLQARPQDGVAPVASKGMPGGGP